MQKDTAPLQIGDGPGQPIVGKVEVLFYGDTVLSAALPDIHPEVKAVLVRDAARAKQLQKCEEMGC